MVILKMIKKSIDWDEDPGPIMEKRVFMNDKMQYYVRRYQPVIENGELIKKNIPSMNFHPEGGEDED